MKRMMKKPYVLAVSIILLYIGAYFFGQYVAKPMREPQQVVRLEEAPIPEDASIPEEIKAPVETLPVANLVNGAASQGESSSVSFFLSDLQYLRKKRSMNSNATLWRVMTITDNGGIYE